MEPETLARELHDVAFAWSHTLPSWDRLRPEHRQWFMDRANTMLATEGNVCQASALEVALGRITAAVRNAFPTAAEAAVSSNSYARETERRHT